MWLRLSGSRRCVGFWSSEMRERHPCPGGMAIGPGRVAQCDGCGIVDRGRRIARDQAVDDREFVLYLAWFGPGLVKVGITAAERGRDRLLEQAAPAFTFLARGGLAPIRAAERTVASAGIARERIGHKAKSVAWWNLPPRTDRAAHLWDAAVQATEFFPQGVTVVAAPEVEDQAVELGLDGGWPDTYGEVTGVGDRSVLGGRVLAVPGRHLLLDPGEGPPLLVDMRIVAGWPTTPPGRNTIAGITTTRRSRIAEDPHGNQDALF